MKTAAEIRKAIESNWNEYLSKYANVFSSNYVNGSSPPSVFVGTYGYPKVLVGPMVPPVHGDTMLFDLPESWIGRNLEDIVNYRVSLVRGVQSVQVDDPNGRYIENLQELAMATTSTDSEVEFLKNTKHLSMIGGEAPPFGPMGMIKNATFSNSSSNKDVEKLYYDKDMSAQGAILELYNGGIEISKIQKCLSIGMFGRDRKLVPTRWSITATDDVISKSLVKQIADFDVVDSCYLFNYEHLGNMYAVILFPSRWMFELQEAWYGQGGEIGFGSDFENLNGLPNYPETAGAYFASRLAVAEYLHGREIQAGVMVLREIRPEYAVPVGVWQVREGIRMAMKQQPVLLPNFEEGLNAACMSLSVAKNEWLMRSKLYNSRKQRSIVDYF